MGHWRYVKDPKKTVASKPGLWHDKIKKKAVELYIQVGNYAQVSRELNVPIETIYLWNKSDWWKEAIKKHKEEELDLLDKKLTDSINSALTNIQDRIINGDTVINTATGETFAVPAKLRDLTSAFNSIMDKRQVIRKQPTKIVERSTTAAHLQHLAEHFEKFVTGKVKKENQLDVVIVTGKQIGRAHV